MAKESKQIVVVDRSPECAQHIDSLLRNSGIALHIIHTETTDALSKALEKHSPFLIVLGELPTRNAPLKSLVELANEHEVQIAALTSPDQLESLAKLMALTHCLVINSEDDQQLLSAVQNSVDSKGGVHAREGMQEIVDELEGRFNLLLDSAREAVAYVHEGLHVYANQAYLDELGVSDFHELEAVSLLELLSWEKAEIKSLLRDMGEGDFPAKPILMKLNKPSGATMNAEVRFSPARFDGEDCIQMMLTEVREKSDVEAELDRLKSLDPITQLSNRSTLMHMLDDVLAENEDTSEVGGLLYFEPDGIGEIQDTLGLAQADAHLKGLAAIMQGVEKSGDLSGRITDHGIALFARRAKQENIESLGQAVIDQYRNHIVEVGGQTLTASCSAGLYLTGSLEQGSDEVIAMARKAFGQAAEEGNQLVRYQPQFSTVVAEEDDRHWAERIRYALSHQDFYSVQHSIVDLEGEGESLFETRSFMREADGDRTVSEFGPPAERADLASLIDRHLIPGLLSAIANPTDRHFIAVSGASIQDDEFGVWLQGQFDELGVQGSQVILQVPTSVAETRLKPLQAIMKHLEPTGCKLSLSEFSAKKRARQLLSHLNVAYVKLESDVSRNLVGQTDRQEALKRIVRAAEPEDVSVVADEVSDSADLAVLWQCGVKLVTGEFLKEAPQVVGQ